jgi:hypothetical protein
MLLAQAHTEDLRSTHAVYAPQSTRGTPLEDVDFFEPCSRDVCWPCGIQSLALLCSVLTPISHRTLTAVFRSARTHFKWQSPALRPGAGTAAVPS